MKPGLASQLARGTTRKQSDSFQSIEYYIQPQVQLIVVFGLQYAALAKEVKGVKASI